jgi:hypothetical protein
MPTVVYSISFYESLGKTLEDDVVIGNPRQTLSNFRNKFLKLADEIQLLEDTIGNLPFEISIDRDNDGIFLHGNSHDILHLQQQPNISDNLEICENGDEDKDEKNISDSDTDEYI